LSAYSRRSTAKNSSIRTTCFTTTFLSSTGPLALPRCRDCVSCQQITSLPCKSQDIPRHPWLCQLSMHVHSPAHRVRPQRH
jgi:hypothetical protein